MVRVVGDATAATIDIMDTEATPGAIIEVTAANPGIWGNKLSVTVSDNTNFDPATPTFFFNVLEDGVVAETFEVSRDETAKDGFGRTLYVEDVVNGQSKLVTVNDLVANTGDIEYATYALTGGTDQSTPIAAAAIATGWDSFLNNEDQVEAQILINGGWADAAVQTKMVSVAESRRNSRAILDAPEDDVAVADILTFRNTTSAVNSHLAGLYAGWVRAYDPYTDREVNVPPSGDVAAAIARKFRDGEPWDSHAGMQNGVIRNALGVTSVFNQADRDTLYSAGVNPVTTINSTAAVIWGQKTMQKARSALDRQNVVDNVLWITDTLVESLQPFVFQPNTSYIRDNANFVCSQFLSSVEARGGLTGFVVKTDDTVNTAQVIDNNRMIVQVFVQPTRTAEFIQLDVIVSPTGVSLG